MLTGTTEKLQEGAVHPVVFGGWVGMLVTLLNMLPVGQLDGGHILRAMIGERQKSIAKIVPVALFGLSLGLLLILQVSDSVGIWFIWGIFAMGLAYAGPANPIDDSPMDRKRIAIGILTFLLAILCFHPIPVEIVQAS
jgi:membrane-associated protease RseP (regulator of RpoE activity)